MQFSLSFDHFILMNTITIKMTWKWGGAKIITCSESFTIDDIATNNGFTELNGYVPCFICKGRILSPAFTLYYHQIKTGDVILDHLSMVQTQIPPLVRRQCFRKFSTFMAEHTMAQIQDEETAKSVDKDFLNWEMVRTFPIVLQEMLAKQEESESETETETETETEPKSVEMTVVQHNREVSSAPLPILLIRDELSLRKSRIASEN
jgi:hypothetical protein